MKLFRYTLLLIVIFFFFLAENIFSSESAATKGKKIHFELKYAATIKDIPETAKTIRIWIPYPQSDAYQRIFSLKIDSPYPSYIHQESEYGNRFLYLEAYKPAGTIEIKYDLYAERYETINRVHFNEIGEFVPGKYPEADFYLQNNSDPTADIDEVNRMARNTLKGKRTYIEKIKALYDYVYDNMEYSKEVEGYGTGHVGRACKVGSGNCIDFHSLFIALATAAGIPSREVANIDLPFEQGVPNYCKANYHCNVEVFLPNHGWFPLDISHAKKGKGSKEFYFGSLDHLRLKLGHGRNILLAPRQQGARLSRLPLNPYVEIDGKPHPAVEASVLVSVYDTAKHRRDRELIAAGEEAIPFTVTDINGRPFDLNEHLGKRPIFINFFTSWCGRCIWETDDINKASSELKDILFVRINLMEPKEKVVEFARKHKIPFTVLPDEEGKICKLYGIKYVPTNVLIDKNGTVIFSGGFFTGEDLRARLEQLSNRKRSES